MLVEPFDKYPANDQFNVWRNFPKVYTISDINDNVKRRLFKDVIAPPYKVEISEDMHEYAAFQEIPFFGAHFFYAFSPTETIDNWQNFNKLNVPKKIANALKLDVPKYSPIKGRVSQRPGRRLKKAQPAVDGEIPQPKAAWEGVVEEVPEPEPEPPKRNMIVIPIDGPVKEIPAALRRLMTRNIKNREWILGFLVKPSDSGMNFSPARPSPGRDSSRETAKSHGIWSRSTQETDKLEQKSHSDAS